MPKITLPMKMEIILRKDLSVGTKQKGIESKTDAVIRRNSLKS